MVSSPVLGSHATNKGITFDVTSVPEFYTIVAEEATVNEETDFTTNAYYTLSGSVYSRVYEYVSSKTYYTLVTTIDESVNASTSFTANAYYTYEDGAYTKATSYTYELTATYLVVDPTVAYTYNSSKLTNVQSYTGTSDITVFDTFVKTFIESINA